MKKNTSDYSNNDNFEILETTGDLPAIDHLNRLIDDVVPALGLPQRLGNEHFYKNALEPEALIKAFLRHSPEEIQTLELTANKIPCYFGALDLTKQISMSRDCSPIISKTAKTLIPLLQKHLFAKPALFAGTTVTEYFVSPPVESASTLIAELSAEMLQRKTEVMVLRNIPVESPFLPRHENLQAQRLLSLCKQSPDFTVNAGKSIPYISIDFQNVDDYIDRLPSGVRNVLQKKLKSKAAVEISQLQTGDRFFYDPRLLQEIYQLYCQTFDQTQLQNENCRESGKLTLNYFHDLLLDKTNNGIVFLYQIQSNLVGFGLSFGHRGNLINKYIGFQYPVAIHFNLWELNWLQNLEYSRRHDFKFYIVGSSDNYEKSSIGAKFTYTRDAVFIKNQLLRTMVNSLHDLCQTNQHPEEERP